MAESTLAAAMLGQPEKQEASQVDDYVIKERRIPLDSSWDVAVVGGGPSGCAAAIAAAREGAKTLLLEATGALGGMGTSGLVPMWCPFTDGKRIIYGGLAERTLKSLMAQMPHVAPDYLEWTPIDPEALKRLYDGMVSASGAKVLFNSFVAGVEMSGEGNVDAIIVGSKLGLTACKAKVFIDCTGDGDLAAWAGAGYDKGDGEGDLQPATHCFILSNVDMYGDQYVGGVRFHSKRNAIDAIVASGKYPLIMDNFACSKLIGPGTVGLNAGHMWDVDNTNPESVTKALIQGRLIAKSFRDALAEFLPQVYGNAFLASTGALLGVRETRRIRGDYVLNFEDYKNLRSFPDEIARNSFFIDVHNKRSEAFTDQESSHYRLKPGESHGIPYRCLTPKGLKNILVAGRCISTDREVNGSTRIMPVCLCTGEAAGIAAGMAVKGDDVDVHAVDTAALRKTLKGNGAWLP